MKDSILITGLGGNVGQGIVRNIKNIKLPIEVIGTDINDFSSGNHLCDKFYKVPFSTSPEYIPYIKKIIAKDNIKLVIPSTDFESNILAKNRSSLGTVIATSEHSTTEIYNDKFKTSLHHEAHNIPFAKTSLPSNYNFNFQKCIAKPKKGRGSRGITINPTDLTHFSDEEYIIQELLEGPELTTCFYVTKDKELHGFVTFIRTLSNGATSTCSVITKFDDKIKKIIKKMIKYADFTGSINIQSIVTSTGDVVPFEINCRISGTNSIRHELGFQDVLYTLEEYYLKKPLSKINVIQGAATRILLDVIYPDASNTSDLNSITGKNYLYYL